MLFFCFHYRRGKYGCRCPLWARKAVLPDKQLCNVTTSCWCSCYGYKEVLCGRHLHLWLGFDRGTLDVGRKEGWKELQPFYPCESGVTLHLKRFWRKPCFSRSSAPGQTLFLTYRRFPYRPEVMTIRRNKISRSGAGRKSVDFPAVLHKRQLHFPKGNETRKKLIDEWGPGCGRS